MIPQRGWGDRELELAFFGEEVDALLVDLGVNGGFFLKTGEQLAHGAWVEKRTGEAMLAYFTRLLEYVDVLFAQLRLGMFGIVIVNDLRQTQCAGHACRPTSNNDDVGFHLGAVDAFQRLRKDQHA